MGVQAGAERVRQVRRQPGDHQREEDADRQHLGAVLEGLVHRAAGAAVARRQAVHHGRPVGRREHAQSRAPSAAGRRELHVAEVGRQQPQPRRTWPRWRSSRRSRSRARRNGQTALRRSGRRRASRPSAAACRVRRAAACRRSRRRAAGSQMPCSQMISMNIRPPRAIEARKVESVPALNARIRSSGRRNIGSAVAQLDHARTRSGRARRCRPGPARAG